MISINGIFNVYYGILLSTLGAMMLVKIYRKNKIVELDGADQTGTRMSQRTIPRLDTEPSNHQSSKEAGGLAAGILHEPMALNDSLLLSPVKNR